jgi:hypothetical protein
MKEMKMIKYDKCPKCNEIGIISEKCDMCGEHITEASTCKYKKVVNNHQSKIVEICMTTNHIQYCTRNCINYKEANK